jgi:hypothetical protein
LGPTVPVTRGLTDEGFGALEAAAPGHVESVRTHLFDQLGPEQMDQLRAICETLLEHLLPSLGWKPPGLLGCDPAAPDEEG